ncbi:MAG: NADH:flavin oxidoreductase [Bacteroidetes bacterium]|nr:NADH:flavin oxidoreductase [Bacteroidota bacterium]
MDLFTPGKIGNLELRNRSIRAAAFEGMCPGHAAGDSLLSYHQSVAKGGIGMTTIAYAAVNRMGLSFQHQLWLREEAVPGLRRVTDAIHAEGAAASIQIGHCGLMAKRSIAGGRPLSSTGGFNLYGPTFPVAMKENQILETVEDFSRAVNLARDSGFDAIEVHAGHGYLISQFLSPFLNKRKDRWGGSFENRSRFMREVMIKVKKEAGNDIAVLVKMNMRDGIKGGIGLDEGIRTAVLLEELGADALVLSGGLVSRTPMYVMRGKMPTTVMGHFIKNPFMSMGVRLFGDMLMKPEPFRELYFLEDAVEVRKQVKLPLVYVGGVASGEAVTKVLDAGFEFVAMARALVHDPGFILKLKDEKTAESGCLHSNYCIAVMYSGEMACFQDDPSIPEKWKKSLGASAT